MLVKQRLTKHNSDTLQQLDIEERVEKLEETLESVVVGYERCVGKADSRIAVPVGGEVLDEGMNGVRKGKRKLVVDGDDTEAPITNGTSRKRPRVIDDDDDE